MRYLIALTISVYMAFQPAFATLNEVDKTNIFSKNMLKNGGFENGKASWTASAGTFAVTTSSPMVGLQHATWDAAASADTLTSGDITIPAGFFARNGVASCVFTTASGTATHEIQVWDGASVLSEATITSSTNPTRTSVNFIYPSSASVAVRIYANADEPSVAIDDCYLGPAEGYNVSSVSQATFVGGMENAGASTCTYLENTSTATSDFVDLSTGTSCAAWTVTSNGPGTISAQGTNDHRLVYTNMPPGNYLFMINGTIMKGNSTAGTAYFRLSDGTTTYQVQANGTGGSVVQSINSLQFHVTVTTTANRTYKIQAADDAVITPQLYNGANSPLSWKVYRFPTSAEQAYTPDLQAMSWSGYFDNTCSFARTNTSYGDATDASCALVERTNQNFGSVTSNAGTNIGINFTPKKAGRYWVCATVSVAGSALGADLGMKFWDGTTTIVERDTDAAVAGVVYTVPLCGIYVATNTSAKTLSIQTKALATGSITIAALTATSAVEWSIVSIDQSLPAPVLTNMVTTGSSGGVKIDVANINCDAGSAITSQNGSWVSSVGNVSGGACAVTLTTGNYSATPYCWASPNTAFASVGLILSTAQSSATAVSVDCEDDASTACTAYDFNLFCIGAR